MLLLLLLLLLLLILMLLLLLDTSCCCWLVLLRDGLRLARWPCVWVWVVCPRSRCIMLAWGLFAAAFLWLLVLAGCSVRCSPGDVRTPAELPPLFARDGCFRVALIFLHFNSPSSAINQRCAVSCRPSGSVGRGGEQKTTDLLACLTAPLASLVAGPQVSYPNTIPQYPSQFFFLNT